jgi:two-component system OmpR family response regulator
MHSSSSPDILIVDEEYRHHDDPICGYLGRQGFTTRCATSLPEMERRLREDRPDLILLDVSIRGGDGLALCRRLSEMGPPVIVASALGEDTDRILGLEMGAQDYLAKPYNPRELLARIRAVLRRAKPPQGGAASTLTFAGLQLDLLRRRLIRADGESTALTPNEFNLLRTFAENPGRPLTRAQLIQNAHDEAEVRDRAINVQISRLRKRLTDESGRDLIVTLRGKGYVFDAAVTRQ